MLKRTITTYISVCCITKPTGILYSYQTCFHHTLSHQRLFIFYQHVLFFVYYLRSELYPCVLVELLVKDLESH